MKIMDISSDDGDYQDKSVTKTSSKAKQARLPFQTSSTDAPSRNKKRKSQASPDVRSAKQAKVNTKDPVLKNKSFKNDLTNIAITEDKMTEEKDRKSIDSNNSKDSLKLENVKEKQDSKNKKNTPSKGKVRKSESNSQVNSLTKFLKKVDDKSNKEGNGEIQKSVDETKKVESKNKSNVNNESISSKKCVKDQETNSRKQDKQVDVQSGTDKELKTNRNKHDSDNEKDSDEENENSDDSSIGKAEESEMETSQMNESKTNEYSEVDITSDDSDDDSLRSDTDCKKTEHEDTDSKDSREYRSKSGTSKSLTPSRKKLLDSGMKEKKLTPKQLEKKLEMQKKRDMREKQRQEREKKLQEEREKRKKEIEEKKREREEKKREREEKEKMVKEQKKKEKELKEQKKQAELEQKQKEKEAKEEDRRKREEAKEEEKRRKEEEKLEAEKKKQKAASNFVSFFVAKKPAETKSVEEEKKAEASIFMPFEVKSDMRVAPLTRRNFTSLEKSKFDTLLKHNDFNKSNLYISEVKNKSHEIRKSFKTWPFEQNDDVIIVGDEDDESSNVVQATKVEKPRAKLLLFAENRRPPYYGTWRKKSKSINPRQPFAKDTQLFDYEVDSDEEWEEEEEGESLRGSDDEKEDDNEDNEYDVDNDFMVPHGYLSEEEILADEEDEDDDLDPEKQKTKLKMMGEQFEAERKATAKKLKPKVIGCVWLNDNNTYPENTLTHQVQFLTARQMWTRNIPLVLTPPADTDSTNDNEYGTPSTKHGIASSARKAKALEEAMPDLIRLFHGNTQSRGFLIKEFLEYWGKKKEGEKRIPKMKLHQKVSEMATRIACPEPGSMQDKVCWWVSEELRTKYLGDEKLPLPNNWTYNLTPKKKSIVPEITEKAEEKEKEKDKKSAPRITHFTKTITPEEMQKKLVEKSSTPMVKNFDKQVPSTSALKPTPPSGKAPKRATLISVPRGESLPKSPRISLMDKFVTKDGSTSTEHKKQDKYKTDDLDDDDCMIIDISDEKIDVMGISPKSDKSYKKLENKDEFAKNEDASMKCNEKSDKNVSTSSEIDVEI